MKRASSVDSAASPPAYHHGALRDALIAAAESLLTEKGLDGFSLRECARRAGVSAAAPAYHFGSVEGLSTAVATLGFKTLADTMEAAAEQIGPDPLDRLTAIGRGYVDFACTHPARFRVTFGGRPLNRSDPAYLAEAKRSFAILRDTVAAVRGTEPDAAQAEALSCWSLVHGFATLLIDNRVMIPADPSHPACAAALAHLLSGLTLMLLN